jgi:hypothetical protein
MARPSPFAATNADRSSCPRPPVPSREPSLGAAAAEKNDTRTEAGRDTIKRSLAMNHMGGWSNGWMNGGMGGGMYLWTVIGVLVVALLVVLIVKASKK